MSVFVDFHSSAVRVLCVQLSSGKEVKSIACKITVRNYLVWIIALYCLLYVPAVKTSQVTIQYWINETNSFCVLVYLISTRWISWFLLMEPEEISRNLAVVSSLARVNESSIQWLNSEEKWSMWEIGVMTICVVLVVTGTHTEKG